MPILPSSSSSLRPGSRGQGVIDLQTGLNAASPTSLPRLKADGIFGPATLARLKEFQRASGLPADGIAGPLTLAALEEASDEMDPVRALQAMRRMFSDVRSEVRRDNFRLALVDDLETALNRANQRRDNNLVAAPAAGVLVNPLFWMLVIIIVFAILLVSDPVHRANLKKLLTLAIEAINERDEEGRKKIQQVVRQVKEFWKQLSESKTECEKAIDPIKLAECNRKFGAKRKAAFDRLKTTIDRILTRRFDANGKAIPLDVILEVANLGKAVKDYVEALNDLLRCLDCPEAPFPDIPDLPLPE